MVLYSTHEGVHSNKSYKQFNGTRRLRSAFANQARTSVKVIGPVLAMVDTKGHFQRFATEPVGLDWFAAFSKGCKWRMGQIWRPNQAISIKLVHALLSKIEQKVLDFQEPDEGVLWVTFGALYVVVCFVVSLRSPEGLLLDLEGLDEMVNPPTQGHLIIPLPEQVKGEHHARAHLLPCIFTTSSGIQVQLRLQEAPTYRSPFIETSTYRSTFIETLSSKRNAVILLCFNILRSSRIMLQLLKKLRHRSPSNHGVRAVKTAYVKT